MSKRIAHGAYSRSIIKSDDFVSAFYLLLGRGFFWKKGYFGKQTNKKWGLVFIWGDILDYL